MCTCTWRVSLAGLCPTADIILKVWVLACQDHLHRLPCLLRGRGGRWTGVCGELVWPRRGARLEMEIAVPVLAVVLLALRLGRAVKESCAPLVGIVLAVVLLALRLGMGSAVVLLALRRGKGSGRSVGLLVVPRGSGVRWLVGAGRHLVLPNVVLTVVWLAAGVGTRGRTSSTCGGRAPGGFGTRTFRRRSWTATA